MIDSEKEDLPCINHEKRLSLLEQSFQQIPRSMDSVNAKMDMILVQITKVAILEEKHRSQQLDIAHAHDKLVSLEQKHDGLQKEVMQFINEARGMARMAWVVWTLLGTTVVALLVKMLFFAASSGMHP
jgi:vacuolar-type H+-ATPase subunit D/Vma8